MTEMATRPDYGAFLQKFELKLISSSDLLPLNGLTFAVKDLFDIDGYVTGFGNPEWANTHSAAISTAPAVLDLLQGGATCVGKTIMGEMAYCVNGVNEHYGTPINPCAPDRLPGGSSSGSAVAVAAKLVDFSLGSDTGGSVRVPASYCNILGFRPSHGVVSVSGVIPMAQSFYTVGWFARDPAILNQVGRVLLHLPEMEKTEPSLIVIAEDCFQRSSIPNNLVRQALVKSAEKLFGGDVLKNVMLGDYVEKNVPSLRPFMSEENKDQDEYKISSLAALSKAMRLLQRYEFRYNHGEWVTTVKPNLGRGPAKLISQAIRSTWENIDAVKSVMIELRAALTTLLQSSQTIAGFWHLTIPTIPGHPPKLDSYLQTLETFRAEAFSLLSVGGVSGFCQVSIPLGTHDGLPVSISLLAKHGSDGFLLNIVETLYSDLQEEFAKLNL